MPRLLHHISARYLTEFVAVLIFAIFWPEHISNPLFQSIVRRV